MRKQTLLLAFALFAKFAFAQKATLAFNDKNKYIFYKVEEVSHLKSEQLYQRAADFLKGTAKAKVKNETTGKTITAEGKQVLYIKSILAGHDNGEVKFAINMEFKNNKYRFWLTDFVFTPYARDRYGSFVPQPGINVPLEELKDRVGKGELDSYMEQINAYCNTFADNLKMQMVVPMEKQKAVKPKVVPTEKW